jgi:hypothetical protein
VLNNFFTIGFRAKKCIARVKEGVPKESGSVLIFYLYFKVKPRPKVMMLI